MSIALGIFLSQMTDPVEDVFKQFRELSSLKVTFSDFAVISITLFIMHDPLM